MNDREKAAIILKSWDEYFFVNWNNEDEYLEVIIKGLREIRRKEKLLEAE